LATCDAGRRPIADACRGRWSRREQGELAGVEGGVLPDAPDNGSGRGPGAARRPRWRGWTPEVKRRSPASVGNEEHREEAKSSKKKRKELARRRRRLRKRRRNRTVVATIKNSETFGWLVAAEVHRRGLGHAKRKGWVGDSQRDGQATTASVHRGNDRRWARGTELQSVSPRSVPAEWRYPIRDDCAHDSARPANLRRVTISFRDGKSAVCPLIILAHLFGSSGRVMSFRMTDKMPRPTKVRWTTRR
jgi:hypothetical protein